MRQAPGEGHLINTGQKISPPTTVPGSLTNPPKKRSAGHYFLLAFGLLFIAEALLFLLTGISALGQFQSKASRFLGLAIFVSITGGAALFCFFQRIARPWSVLFGLLLLQPAFSAAWPNAQGTSQSPAVGIVSGAIALALLIYAALGRSEHAAAGA